MNTHARLALAVLSAATLMTVLDGSIVTVALPEIQRDLGFDSAGLSWTVNAYLIAFGGLLLLGGRLGDLFGRKTIFLIGNAVFTAASLIAGAATTPALLIGARFLQGVGSAFASAVALGILVTLFTDHRQRKVAIGVFGFTGAAGAAIGQVLGGVLTDAFGWHWIFLINVPIGLATVALAVAVLPADRAGGGVRRADLIGATLVTAGLMLGIYTVVGIESHGWTSSRTLGLAAVSLLLLAAFVIRQSRVADPLLPLRVFRSRAVSGANLVQMLTVSAMFAFQVLLALYLQRVLGYAAVAAVPEVSRRAAAPGARQYPPVHRPRDTRTGHRVLPAGPVENRRRLIGRRTESAGNTDPAARSRGVRRDRAAAVPRFRSRCPNAPGSASGLGPSLQPHEAFLEVRADEAVHGEQEADHFEEQVLAAGHPPGHLGGFTGGHQQERHLVPALERFTKGQVDPDPPGLRGGDRHRPGARLPVALPVIAGAHSRTRAGVGAPQLGIGVLPGRPITPVVEIVDEGADPGLGRGDPGRAFDEVRTGIGHTLFSCGKGGATSRECATVTGIMPRADRSVRMPRFARFGRA